MVREKKAPEPTKFDWATFTDCVYVFRYVTGDIVVAIISDLEDFEPDAEGDTNILVWRPMQRKVVVVSQNGIIGESDYLVDWLPGCDEESHHINLDDIITFGIAGETLKHEFLLKSEEIDDSMAEEIEEQIEEIGGSMDFGGFPTPEELEAQSQGRIMLGHIVSNTLTNPKKKH
jgi:hypothetical protein